MNDLLRNLGAAAIYALLGIVLLELAFLAIERMTPGTLWSELID